jgi:D-glycero-D-manno-heptose 1,7-bisphosphate phosphatase
VTPRLAIFDADGTLRWTTVPGQMCPHRADEWRLMPGVTDALRTLRAQGVQLAVASNQNDVARGLLTRDSAEAMLRETLAAACGGWPAEALVELCTCPPDGDCDCRKPRPGMLRRLLARAGVPAAVAVLVGDLEIDRAPADAAGVPFRWASEYFGWPPR